MPLPAMGPVAIDVYQQLRLLAPTDEQHGWPLAHFIAAKYGPIEEVAAWVRDTDDGPGYGMLLDIDGAPAKALLLPAQLKGVVIPDGLTETEQRAWVRTAEGQHRGMVDALKAAGRRHLTGTQDVQVLERVGGNAYDITVITRTSETPDPATTLADFRSAKRIGIRLTHVVSSATVLDALTGTVDALTGTVDAL